MFDTVRLNFGVLSEFGDFSVAQHRLNYARVFGLASLAQVLRPANEIVVRLMEQNLFDEALAFPGGSLNELVCVSRDICGGRDPPSPIGMTNKLLSLPHDGGAKSGYGDLFDGLVRQHAKFDGGLSLFCLSKMLDAIGQSENGEFCFRQHFHEFEMFPFFQEFLDYTVI
jgi:hypothetical protein